MNPWQFLTIATLAVATVFFGVTCVVAWRVAYDPTFVDGLVRVGWLKSDRELGFQALMVAFAGFSIAAIAVRAQQSVVGWAVGRQMRRLKEAYHDVEMALGTEAAEVFLAYKAQQMGAISARSGWKTAVFG